jgi:hypothetical protein
METQIPATLSDKERALLLKARKGATAGFNVRDWETITKLFGLSFQILKEKREIVGIDITTPAGDKHEIRKQPNYRVVTFYGLTAWLAEHGYPLNVTASKLLGIETPEEEKARKDYKARDWTNTGTCGVCEQNVKMRDDQRLVHHGFQRPGDGMIHGDCFGVGYRPHELSSEAASDFVEKLLKPRAERLRQRLNDLREGKVAEIQINQFSYFVEPKYIHVGEMGWDRALEREISLTEANVKQYAEQISYFTKKVGEWKLDKLPEVKMAELYGQKAE